MVVASFVSAIRQMTYQFDPASFVLVKYCTQPYSFMRKGALALTPWLRRFQVPYTIHNSGQGNPVCVIFTLPDEWWRYTVIDEELITEMAPCIGQVREAIFTVRQSKQLMRYHNAPTEQEFRLLHDKLGLAPI